MCYVHNQWYDISCATLYDDNMAFYIIALSQYVYIAYKFSMELSFV